MLTKYITQWCLVLHSSGCLVWYLLKQTKNLIACWNTKCTVVLFAFIHFYHITTVSWQKLVYHIISYHGTKVSLHPYKVNTMHAFWFFWVTKYIVVVLSHSIEYSALTCCCLFRGKVEITITTQASVIAEHMNILLFLLYKNDTIPHKG